jgi:Tol biopolymer transport system component
MAGSETGSLAGQTLAQYELLERQGEGELGIVYLARDTVAARDVALEVLPAKSPIDPERLRQEVKAAGALHHWSIAEVYECATAAGVTFVAREHFVGRALEQILETGPIEPAVALACARQIGGALAAGHAIGVTHRHLNAANIVLGEQNRVKLVNFGLTVPPSSGNSATLAPEQLDGRGADARSDIYSFGMVLGRMLGPAPSKPLAAIIARATRKNAGRRFQLMEDVLAALDRAASDPRAAAKNPRHRILLFAGALTLAIAAIGWWALGGRSAANQVPKQLTSDSGLTTDGVISPDGRVIVYASDRASPGTLNLWMQSVSGGQPVRLTQGPDDDRQPNVSPDGTRIVFRSERDGGGVYLAAATGGAPQLLIQGGRDPRYSPDGRWISYWSGDPLQPRGAAVWVIASSGGQPVPVHPEFADARYPLWAPDGKHLLFAGHAGGLEENSDWYVAPFANGRTEGHATRTGAERLLHMQKFRENSDGFYSGAFAVPEAWVVGQVLFSGRMTPMGKQGSGQPRLLRIPISPDIMQATGAAHEVTSGEWWDAHPSLAANGRVVYSRRELKAEIWSVAPDGSGDLRRVTEDTGDVRPSLSRDGTRLAYRLPSAGTQGEIRVIETAGGKQIARVHYDSIRDWPVLLSPSGDELVYTSRGLMRMSLPEGSPERVFGRGWDQPTSWSSDGKYLLVQRGWRGLGLLDLTTGHDQDLLRDERFPVAEARFSPDDKWIAFTLLSPSHPGIFIVPLAAAPDSARIAVTAEDSSAGSPAWSADGTQIYFLNSCQGFRCIWARRLDARSKKPLGEAFAIRHFHGARYSLLGGIDPQNVGLAAAGGRLVFGMFDTTGNIWSLSALPRR